VMGHDGIEQRGRAAIAAITAAVARHPVAHGLVHVVARQEVGYADREIDDVLAFGLELLRLVGDDHDRAGLGAGGARGELGHATFLENSTIHFTTAMLRRITTDPTQMLRTVHNAHAM